VSEQLIEITVNGSPRQITQGTSVARFVESLQLPWRFVAVERNRELVPRGKQAECILAAGDELEIVTLVGGG
jgi:sulfur carrier protein